LFVTLAWEVLFIIAFNRRISEWKTCAYPVDILVEELVQAVHKAL